LYQLKKRQLLRQNDVLFGIFMTINQVLL